MATFTKTVNCSNCNKKLSIFRYLNEDEISFLNEHRHEVRFNEGETIFKQGGALTHIACLTTGIAKIYIEGLHKKNLLLKLLRPTELVAGPGLFNDLRHYYTVSAITESTACFIEVKAFEEVTRRNTVFAAELFKWTNQRIIRNFDKLISLTQKHMPGRIADALIYLSEDVYENKKFTVNISRQDIADLSAMTKESSIRIIKEFKTAGYIKCEGNNFEIIDADALRKVSING